MDTDRFDGLTRTLAATGSRRRVLAALAGGLLPALGNRGAGASDDKVRICHRTSSDPNAIVMIEVSVNAVSDHEAHGDVRYKDCCLNRDCDNDRVCIDGSCRGTCVGPAEVCKSNHDCCGPLCCDNGICDNDCGFD